MAEIPFMHNPATKSAYFVATMCVFMALKRVAMPTIGQT